MLFSCINVLFSFDQGENLDLLSGAVAALTAYYSKSCNQVGDFVIH